ncbi:MAG TPA: DUF4175 family protein [Tepidisphaeraceae bacterium]|jgi:hypothetical protein|nr:DUF4175 family protein [Tepidisphaeraceae bacterium]
MTAIAEQPSAKPSKSGARAARRIHPLLDRKLQGLQARQKSADAASGSAILVLLFLGLIFLGAMIDWFVDLPRAVRMALLAIDLCVLAFFAWREVIAPLVQGPSDDELALRVEDAKPIFRSRLISSVQLMRPGAIRDGVSKSVARQMIIETAELAKSVNFTEIVRLDRPIKLAIGAAAAVLACIALLLLGGAVPVQLAERQFLMNVPLPHFTEADCYSKDFTIATGDSATVGAFSRRLTPHSGVVEVRYASGEKATFTADRVAGQGPPKFAHTIQAVQEPFEYRIHLGDGVTPYYHVDVQPPPALLSLSCQQVWPAYAHQPDQTLNSGNLTMLQGSKLRIRVKSSKPLMRLGESENTSHVHFAGSETDSALMVDPADPTVATILAPVPNTSTGISIHLVDQSGLSSRDPVIYPLQLVPDQPPAVTLTFPENKDELATVHAMFTVGFHASDDVGVEAITLKYQLDNGKVQSVPIDIQPITQKQGSSLDIKGRYVWDLSKLTPLAAHPQLLGTDISYWIEAADGNNISGPGVTDSERYTLHVVDEAAKREELSEEMSEMLSGFQSATDDAQSVENDLGDIVYEKK